MKFSTFKYKDQYILLNTKKRNKYFSKKYDISMIEIFSDEIREDIKYLELEENIMKKDLKNKEFRVFEGETLYIIQYPEEEVEKPLVSYGIITSKKCEKEYNFTHSCNTKQGSSGSPILSKMSRKILGIHNCYRVSGKKIYNQGNFINYPINDSMVRTKKKR